MPKGKSVYDIYFEAGASMGPYKGALQKVADVWSGVDFSREKFAWETEKRERNLDTLLATTELVATVGGSMTGFGEGSAAIQMKQAEAGYSGTDWEEFKETDVGKEHIELYSPKKIGRGGEPWEKGKFENLWQRPRYQFGEDVVMSGSEVRKYGRDVKEYGKYGVDLPVDIYKSMHEEYREGYERPEGDWYVGKYAKGALGVAEKVGQTLVPGGKVGYGNLYSGLGKKLKTGPKPLASVPKLKTKAGQQDYVRGQFGGDLDLFTKWQKKAHTQLGRRFKSVDEEIEFYEKHGSLGIE